MKEWLHPAGGRVVGVAASPAAMVGSHKQNEVDTNQLSALIFSLKNILILRIRNFYFQFRVLDQRK